MIALIDELPDVPRAWSKKAGGSFLFLVALILPAAPLLAADTTPPTAPGQPKEGSSSSDLDFDADGNYIIYWSAASDPQSSITAYEPQERIGLTGTWKPVTPKPNFNSLSYTISNRLHNTRYFYRVRAKNGAGLWGAWSAESDGILVDKTGPLTPVITDDGTVTLSSSQLHARWTASDPESGISEYQYEIRGDSAVGIIITGWASTGTATEVTRTGLSLTNGKTYFFNVKTKNGSELWSPIGNSDGIYVNKPPVITAVTPADGSRFYPPATINCAVTASDPSGDPLSYRFLLDGQVVRDWGSSATFSLSTSTLSAGLKTLQAEARDPYQGQASRTAQLYLFRKPLEANE